MQVAEFGDVGKELEIEAAADEALAEANLHGHLEDKPMNELGMKDKDVHEAHHAAALGGHWK